jgi:hypothetical protein
MSLEPGRNLDELYWDTRCTDDCGCRSLKEALVRHPELQKDRGGEDADERKAEQKK